MIFKSLYSGNLVYEKTQDDLIGLIATSRMFNLEKVADIISQTMKDSTNIKNVVNFYNTFCGYNFPELEKDLFRWILLNYSYWQETKYDEFCNNFLAHANYDLMDQIVKHPEFIVKDELLLYKSLKQWLIAHDFKIENLSKPFLETDEGKPYKTLFSAVHIEHLLFDKANIEAIMNDNIYPLSTFEHKYVINNVNHWPEKSFRLGIFHVLHGTNLFRFKPTTLDCYGIQLTFDWSLQKPSTWVWNLLFREIQTVINLTLYRTLTLHRSNSKLGEI